MNKECKFLVLLLLSLILTFSILPSAHADVICFVSATSSDRVHLRAAPSAEADSLGLYFSGTPAIDLENSNENWAYVMIGAEKGYVRRDLIESLNSYHQPMSKWKIGTVRANGSVNMRAAPTKEAPKFASLKSGKEVIVLGETYNHWYYVKADQTFGYIMAQYVKISSNEWRETSAAVLPEGIAGEYWFCSGAGAWMTQITLMEDGRFWGYFHDSDMGDDGPGYSLGTEYESSFTGILSPIRRINTYEYEMQVTFLQGFGCSGEEIKNQIRTITTSPYGVVVNSRIQFYLPGTHRDQLPQMHRSHFDFSDQRIKTAGFYCPDHEALWVQYSQD